MDQGQKRYQEPADQQARRRRKALRGTTALPPEHPPKPEATGPPGDADEFVPDPQVAKEFNITLMSLWRWTNDPTLGFPPPIQIRGKNFRSRKQIEAFKQEMIRRAIATRNKQAEGVA